VDPLEVALRELREARPSPDFVPRVRAHVEASRRPAWPLWKSLSIAAAAAIVMFAASHARRVADRGTVPQPLQLQARSSVLHPAGSLMRAPGRRYRMDRDGGAPHARIANVTRPAATVATVLVPADQRAVIGRLVEALASGHADGAAVARSLTAGTEVVVAPIHIEPVVVPAIPTAAQIDEFNRGAR
jgi:hypothetical protein